jgi:hypothetical protein
LLLAALWPPLASNPLPDSLPSESESFNVGIGKRVSEGVSSEVSALGRRRASARRGACATLLCLLCFAAFWAGAMALYPGGTWLDRTQLGQSFFGNFFCDLTQPVSLSGVANPVGSRLAQCAMFFFGGALLGFFWLVPRHFPLPDDRAPQAVFRAGLCAVCIFAAVPLTPSELFGWLHRALSLAAGLVGFLAGLGALMHLVLVDRRRDTLVIVGVLTLLTTLFAAAAFVVYWDAPAPPLLVPSSQKVAALLLSAWIAGVASRVLLDNHSPSA